MWEKSRHSGPLKEGFIDPLRYVCCLILTQIWSSAPIMCMRRTLCAAVGRVPLVNALTQFASTSCFLLPSGPPVPVSMTKKDKGMGVYRHQISQLCSQPKVLANTMLRLTWFPHSISLAKLFNLSILTYQSLLRHLRVPSSYRCCSPVFHGQTRPAALLPGSSVAGEFVNMNHMRSSFTSIW